jgi:hypothetical protein
MIALLVRTGAKPPHVPRAGRGGNSAEFIAARKAYLPAALDCRRP